MDSPVNVLVFDSAGNLYAGGAFGTAGGVTANGVAKWNGSAWSSLGTGMNNMVSALAFDNTGNLYAGGWFTTAGGIPANYIAKWDGSSWSALGLGMNSYVLALVCDSTGNLYAGGDFTTAGSVTAYSIAMWNGSAWSPLGTGSGMDSNVCALTCDSTGNLYAGGNFTIMGGVAANNIAMWNGSVWSALGSGMGGSVYALVCDSEGNLYAGTQFTTTNGGMVCYIAKWNGSSWSDLCSYISEYSEISPSVNALAFDSAGNLYAGGGFITVDGSSANYIAMWDGSAWSALGSGLNSPQDYNTCVSALACDSAGNLYAGGWFITAGDKPSSYIAEYLQKINTPTFSPAGGTYTSVQSVTISCFTSGATIYYTTDGSTPTTSSSKYSSAIVVSSATTLKAYAVMAGIADSAVASATYTFAIVFDSGPTAMPNTAGAGETISFSSAASGGTGTLTYTWTFGDGGTGIGANPTYAYATAGNFTATVIVTDTLGNSASASVTVTVTVPTFTTGPTATPNPAGVGETVSFSSSATSGTGTLTYAWTFGDGVGIATGANPAYAYAAAGTYTVTVTATDAVGDSNSSSVVVTVAAPVVGTGTDITGDGYSDSFLAATGFVPSQPAVAGAVQPLSVSKTSIKLNFAKPGNDAISMSGTFSIPLGPTGFAVTNQKVYLVIGGVIESFTLSSKGMSTPKGNNTFSVKFTSQQTGVTNTQTGYAVGKYSVMLKKGSFATALAAYGLVKASSSKPTITSVTIPAVTVIFNGVILQKDVTLSYKATSKSGTAH
jgi:PKD repeat protein